MRTRDIREDVIFDSEVDENYEYIVAGGKVYISCKQGGAIPIDRDKTKEFGNEIANISKVYGSAVMFEKNIGKLKRCPTCGRIVPRGHGYKKSQVYCSKGCWQTLTPRMIEAAGDIPIKEFLTKTLNEANSIKEAAATLRIGRVTLYDWIKKLGIKKENAWV